MESVQRRSLLEPDSQQQNKTRLRNVLTSFDMGFKAKCYSDTDMRGLPGYIGPWNCVEDKFLVVSTYSLLMNFFFRFTTKIVRTDKNKI